MPVVGHDFVYQMDSPVGLFFLTVKSNEMHVELAWQSQLFIAEVHFFFKVMPFPAAQATEALALVSRFSPPRMDLLRESHGTYFACKAQGDVGLTVIKANSMQSVVSMIPHLLDDEEYWYMFEKPGLALAGLGGFFDMASDDDPEA
ncbi:hypothetical protein PAXINDRAFT_11308 [Paxillus involutus ATCC 200175]|uniref:Uncharacterized protein n=1 Tax=Paxillus involutus ATCC 200175 TaxID=664439 RepID=A0A0C9U9T8_PAXIN|nr:hypothetical protein PAXINDRAFT_11308 [Paxillus involutus ATCC 200175]